MSKLSDKLTSGVVVDKEMAVIERDFDGNILSIKSIEYITNNEVQRFLLKEKNNKEKQKLVEQDKLSKELEEKSNKESEYHKERTLSAFDRWYRDVSNGITEFDNSKYEEVIYWYRTYLEDDSVEIHEELTKYL